MWKLSQRVIFSSKLLRTSFLSRADATPQLIGKSYFARGKKTDDGDDEEFSISKLFQPGNVKQGPGSQEARDLAGDVTKSQILEALNLFYKKPTIRELCEDYGMDGIQFCYFQLPSIDNNLLKVKSNKFQNIYSERHSLAFENIVSIKTKYRPNFILNCSM